EDDLALQDAGGVVQVHDGLLGTRDGLVGALDQVLARLGQHLDGDVVGNEVFFDELTHEVEVRLARRREPDLDLLVAHADEQLEHDALALGRHRVDEGLVSVSQVYRAPAGRLSDAGRGPGAIGEIDGDLLVERPVLVDRHRRRALGVMHGGLLLFVRNGRASTSAATRKALAGGLVAAAKKKQTAEKHGISVHPRDRPSPNHGMSASFPPGCPVAKNAVASRASSKGKTRATGTSRSPRPARATRSPRMPSRKRALSGR